MFEIAANIVLLAGVSSSGGPVPVGLDPPRGKPDGTARLVIVDNPSRPVQERLSVAGVKGAKPVRVRKGSGRVIAQEFEREVPVSAGRLSTLHIGKTKLLLALEPRSVLGVRYDDCANYCVEAQWLASYGEYCEREERPCRTGYTESTEPAAHEDGMCEQLKPKPTDDREVKYCVRLGEFRVRARPGTSFGIAREGDEQPTSYVVPASGLTPFHPSVYQRCSRDTVVTSSDRAVVVVGSTQRLTIEIAPDGRIVGGVVEKGE